MAPTESIRSTLTVGAYVVEHQIIEFAASEPPHAGSRSP